MVKSFGCPVEWEDFWALNQSMGDATQAQLGGMKLGGATWPERPVVADAPPPLGLVEQLRAVYGNELVGLRHDGNGWVATVAMAHTGDGSVFTGSAGSATDHCGKMPKAAIDASCFSSDMCHATAEQVAAVADAYEAEVRSRRDAKAIAPFRALLDACVLPALVEAWKARNPHATAVVDPSQGWAVVCLGLGPWKGTSRLWWAGGEAYGARAEALLEAAWAEASDAVARGWKPEGRHGR
jgi:hypothetical protein